MSKKRTPISETDEGTSAEEGTPERQDEGGSVEEAVVEEATQEDVAEDATEVDEVADLRREVDRATERLKRATAEFSNETKRIARQAREDQKYAVEGLIHDLLPVFDAMHSAREALSGADQTVLQGLDLVEKELMNVLSRHGVRRIESVESPFDPTHHEAVVVVDHPELAANVVAMEMRPGFTLHGRVVRPAHVAVARGPADGAERGEEVDADAGDETNEAAAASPEE
ncbi:MAG: nucleotide exchange factor GrpE [Planctomycetota bacterium]|jgi:molecular chaperone GrpE